MDQTLKSWAKIIPLSPKLLLTEYFITATGKTTKTGDYPQHYKQNFDSYQKYTSEITAEFFVVVIVVVFANKQIDVYLPGLQKA